MILIADSGSSKTDWWSIDKIYKFQTKGLNPFFLSEEEISHEIKSELLPKLPEKVSQIFFYGTGVNSSESAIKLVKGIELGFESNLEIKAESDVVGAAKAVLGKQEGIACILGTGSNSCFWNGNEISFQIPPLGFWLGDEGSGAHIGKLLILDYLHQEMPIEIRQIFEKDFGKIDRIAVLKEKNSRYFAQFSLWIYENRHFEYLINLVENSIEKYFKLYISKYPNYHTYLFGFVGGVAYYYQEIIKKQALKYKISNLVFIQKPIEGLVFYHSLK